MFAGNTRMALDDLSEPSRRAILDQLRDGEKPVNAIVAITGMKQPNVSNHLARMRERGVVSARRAGRLVFYHLADPIVRALLDMSGSSAPPETDAFTAEELQLLSLRFYEAIAVGNQGAADALISDCLARDVKPETLLVDVLQDALHRLGDGRTYTRGCSADELLAIGIAERTAARVALHYGTGRSNGRRCVLGSPPGNQHTLGLRMISDVLRHHGWDTLFLGAGAPRAAFADLVRRKEPDLVLVSCPTANLAEEARGLLEELRRMRRVSDRPFLIGVGGSYVNACPRYASEVGADFTAPDARALSHAVTHLFGA